MIYRINNLTPEIASSAFIAPDATIIGDVKIGENTSVWFGAVIRGDVDYITIGQRVNIQDHSTLHVTRQKYPLVIGDDVTIAHRVLLHGCRLASNTFIGMGAIIMDGAEIGEYSIVAAGSLVTARKKFPPGSMIMGSPARLVREITSDERDMIERSVSNYLEYMKDYKNNLEAL